MSARYSENEKHADEEEHSSTITSQQHIVQVFYLWFLVFFVVATALFLLIRRVRPGCRRRDEDGEPSLEGQAADDDDDDDDDIQVDVEEGTYQPEGGGTLYEKAGLQRLRRSERKLVMEKIMS